MSTRFDEPAWDECPRCRAVVPAGTSFCPECGEDLTTRRASQGRARERSAPPWLPIVLGLGGLLIVVIGVLVVMLLTRGEDPNVAADASASASPSATAQPSASASASPEPTASPTPEPRAAQANTEIVEVTSDGVELRTQPNGGDLIGALGAGGRVFVIGAPQDAGGERWYRVAVVDGPYSECEPSFCPNDIGYLSDGASEADATLADTSLDCPSSPMTATALAELLPLERLSCYGGSPIVVRGTLNMCDCDGPIEVRYSPAWLAGPISQFLFNGSQTLWLRFEDLEVEPEDLTRGDIVEATVAMEHDDAPDCDVSAPAGSDVPSDAEIVLFCRTQLVAIDVNVTGHDDSVTP